MRKAIVLVSVGLYLLSPELNASTSAKFLELGFGAKAPGMADCFIANVNDISAGYYNPALWKKDKTEKQWLLSHSLHIQDTTLSQLAFSQNNFGFAVNYFSVSEIEGRDINQQLTGDFNAYDLAFSGGYGFKYQDFIMGVNLKYVKQKIKNADGNAFATDLGMIYEFKEKPIVLGATISNLGTKLKLEDSSYPLPLSFKTGLSYYIEGKNPAKISAQLDLPKDESLILRIGGEYSIKSFSLRLGWKSLKSSQRDAILGDSNGIEELYGFYFGFGIKILGLDLDYALLPYGELGSSHRFAIGGKF